MPGASGQVHSNLASAPGMSFGISEGPKVHKKKVEEKGLWERRKNAKKVDKKKSMKRLMGEAQKCEES